MSDFKKELDSLQEEINIKKEEKVRIEERIKSLKEDLEKNIKKLEELGVKNIEEAKKELENLEEQIESGINKVRGQLK